MDPNQNFYLLKNEDGTVFGPVPFTELKSWADQALISPFDKVSTDQAAWNRAPMLAELGMDYLIQVSDKALYGPTTIGAIKEFLNAGEITGETVVINCKDGSTCKVSSLPFQQSQDPDDPANPSAPKAARLTSALRQRIKELETVVAEQQRYIAQLEEAYSALKQAGLNRRS